MAAAKTLIASPRRAADNGAWAVALLTGDAAYVGLGYPVAPADFSLVAIDHIAPSIALDGAGNKLDVVWDPLNGTIRFFYPTGGTAASPAAPAQPVAITTPDAGAVALTGSAAKPPLTAVTTPGAGKEVPIGANLAGYSVRLIAFGQAR